MASTRVQQNMWITPQEKKVIVELTRKHPVGASTMARALIRLGAQRAQDDPQALANALLDQREEATL